ncbi:MAG: OmpA family protein [Cyclobacteriaceae bacterium]
MSKKYTVLIAIFAIWGELFAQADQLVKLAEHAFYDEDFELAIELYSELEQSYPEEKSYRYHQLITEQLTTKRGSDITELMSYQETEGKTDEFYNYWMGRICMSRYELNVAEEHFRAFLKINAYKTNEIVRETKFFLEWIERVKPFINNPDDYEIVQLPAKVNSEYSELSPAFFSGHNELLFASDRPVDSNSEYDGRYSIFHSERQGDSWSEPTAVDHLGQFDFEFTKLEVNNEDGKLFTYNNSKGDLYYSTLDKVDGWSLPVEFDKGIKDKGLTSHFFINDAEDHILFVKGSKKNHDIHETYLKDGKWTTPAPIPGLVNTVYDEDSPFMSHDGKTLYFSSNSPLSIGGYDIFKSSYDETLREWTSPVNMGFPINTLDDEMFFEVNQGDKSGYLSSNRLHSTGGYDMYYFYEIDKIMLAGTVSNQADGNPVSNVEILFHPLKYEDESFKTTSNQDGSYALEIINKDDFYVEFLYKGSIIHKDLYSSIPPVNGSSLEQDFEIEVPENLSRVDYAALFQGVEKETDIEMLGSKFRTGEKVILNNLYFDFKSYNLNASSAEALEKVREMMSKYHNLKIEISGHTDNIGEHESNIELSRMRAEKVREYLVRSGVSDDRLVARGYGEMYPLASNDDERDGRELNRRIEIMVLE